MRRLLVMLLGILASLFMVWAPAQADGVNDASYWEDQGEHPAVCYKHDPPTNGGGHGSLTDGGKAVTLVTFNQAWPGDHWELLVVKAGDDRNVFQHPVAGTAYYPPLNNGGQKPQVSHWIVCKGETPLVTTTSTSTSTTSTTSSTSTSSTTTTTTSLPPSSTSSSTSTSTSSSVPDSTSTTTSTVPVIITTTIGEPSTTITTPIPSSTSPATVSSLARRETTTTLVSRRLAETGTSLNLIYGAALLMLAGTALTAIRRR